MQHYVVFHKGYGEFPVDFIEVDVPHFRDDSAYKRNYEDYEQREEASYEYQSYERGE